MLFCRHICLLATVLLGCLLCSAQQSEQFSFTHFRLADGLSSNIVNNAVQDSRGFIWLSTNNGLQRFDGNKFLTFKADAGNPTALPSDEIMQVYLDRKKNLWVVTTDNKIGLFDPQTFRYTEVPIRQWKPTSLAVEKSLIETSDGRLLLHLRKTNLLFSYNPKQNAFEPSSYVPFPRQWSINYLYLDQPTNKFFMASDSGLAVYNPKTNTTSFRNHNPEGEVLVTKYGLEKFTNYIFINKSRQLFFEQWNKNETHPVLKQLDLNTSATSECNLQKQYGLGYHQVKGILAQQNGKQWIYGLPFLAEYTGGNPPLQFLKKDYNKERDLKFSQVFSMFEDRQRNVWICTDNGIYLFNPDAQLFHNFTLSNPKRFSVEGKAQTSIQLPNGEIWLGYRDLGLYQYSSQLHPLPLPASLTALVRDKSVWDLHLHRTTGKLWIGLQGGNLVVYDTLTKKAELLSPPEFEKRTVTQITEDRNGNLWFGTQGGILVRWNVQTGKTKAADGFSLVKKTGIIEKLFTDQQGTIWVAAFGEGVMQFDPGSGRILNRITNNGPQGYRLWNNNPKDILQYNDTMLVIASGALNFVNTKTGRVRTVSTRDGLPTNTVQSLAKDAAGMLWLGTMNGLCMANLNPLSFTVYDQSDGLLNDQFNVAGANRLSDGRLLFTSAESFLVFDPSFTQRKDPVSQAVITDVKLMNQSLSVDSLLQLKQVGLNHNATNLAIEFSALNFNRLHKFDYYYQLENFDTAWIRSDNRHQAVYTFLPTGAYRFKVKAQPVGGGGNPHIAMFSLRVYPPFWRTWWFFLMVLLLAAGLLYLLYNERIKRLITLHDIRSDIASHLHRDVSTTLNNINVLSQIAKLKADKDITRSKELIDEISGKSYNMMLSMDEILWSIDPGNDTMEKTLLRLVEFSKMLEVNYGTSIELVVNDKVKNLRLNMRVRHDFFIFCKEALQNLIRQLNVSSIMVDIDFAYTKIFLKMLSTGPDNDSESAGIQEMKTTMERLAEAMQASLTFERGRKDTVIVLVVQVKPYSYIRYNLFGSKK